MKGYKVGSTIVWTVANNATAVIVRSLNGRLIAMVTERGNETYPDGSTFTINDYMTHNVTKVDAPLRTVIYGGRRIHDGYEHYAVLSKSGKALTAISAGCRRFRSTAKALQHWKRRERRSWAYNRKNPDARTQYAIRLRAKDREMDRWSRDFVRKVERVLAKNKK